MSKHHGGLSPLLTTMPIHCGVQLSSTHLNSMLEVAKRLLVKDVLNHLDNVAHQVYYSNDSGWGCKLEALIEIRTSAVLYCYE